MGQRRALGRVAPPARLCWPLALHGTLLRCVAGGTLQLQRGPPLPPSHAQVELVLLDERYERAPLPCQVRDEW